MVILSLNFGAHLTSWPGNLNQDGATLGYDGLAQGSYRLLKTTEELCSLGSRERGSQPGSPRILRYTKTKGRLRLSELQSTPNGNINTQVHISTHIHEYIHKTHNTHTHTQ